MLSALKIAWPEKIMKEKSCKQQAPSAMKQTQLKGKIKI